MYPWETTGMWRSVQWKHKVVRDLDWSISSPHLLDGQDRISASLGFQVLSDEVGESLRTLSITWLQSLDDDPTELTSWLSDQRHVNKLGFYFAGLVEFWIRFCPCLKTCGKVAVRQQVVEEGSRNVIGQLKCAFLTSRLEHGRLLGADFPGSQATSPSACHWEYSIKYFVDAGDHDQLLPGAFGATRFVGPYLHENLGQRIVETERKVQLGRSPGVQRWARETLAGDTSEASALHSVGILRGYLFHRVRPSAQQSRDEPPPSAIATAVASPCTPPSRMAADALPSDVINPRHLRGWWAGSLEELRQAMPESLGLRGPTQARWVLLVRKCHWLGPVVAVPVASIMPHLASTECHWMSPLVAVPSVPAASSATSMTPIGAPTGRQGSFETEEWQAPGGWQVDLGRGGSLEADSEPSSSGQGLSAPAGTAPGVSPDRAAPMTTSSETGAEDDVELIVEGVEALSIGSLPVSEAPVTGWP
ncbi:hypothetical protein CYMTET_7786 [Cymbomonas tetramitiformis]|uniref:Uncharacterized protein n=1 Tax=Cymbomonas tetramitiformis TaxID=36881 RepID=A0AAE0GUC9_9CHLO|nr:hypothetical protein CYMTET_7786 [Cymbomonas tetramitiformis]